MVEIEVTVADERDVHGLMRRLRGLFDSSEVTYDSERKHVRVRAEWESRTVTAVVDAVKEWMDETGADSASLVVGNRSFTILRPDAASAARTTDDQSRALATIADFVRSAHTAKNSAALLGHACERVSEVFGLARVG